MLVLSRKEGESIVIKGRIVVSVLNIRGHRVQLGIEAPKKIAVHRKEIWEAIMNDEPGERRVVCIPKKG